LPAAFAGTAPSSDEPDEPAEAPPPSSSIAFFSTLPAASPFGASTSGGGGMIHVEYAIQIRTQMAIATRVRR